MRWIVCRIIHALCMSCCNVYSVNFTQLDLFTAISLYCNQSISPLPRGFHFHLGLHVISKMYWSFAQFGLLVMQKESKAKAQGVLVAGLVTAIASLAGVLGVQAMFTNLGRP